MERRAGLSVLAAALIAVAAPSPAGAAVYLTRQEALAQAFPGARIERRAIVLTPAQAQAVEARARARLSSRLVTAYAAWRGDSLIGTALFDTRTVRTMPGVFMIAVAPDTTVARVDVLAFHEPPDYLPSPRWLGLLARRRLDDRLWPGRDIRTIAGATLSTRAIAEAVRQALAVYELAVARELTGAR